MRAADAARAAAGLPRRAAHEAVNAAILARSGLLAPVRPDRVARMGLAAARYGASPATALAAGAARHPHRRLLTDDAGSLTYRECDRRTDALAHGLGAHVRAGDRVAIMCRDGRGFVEALMATGKLGADALLLNTSFAGPQLAEVCAREGAVAVIHDGEFGDALDAGARAGFTTEEDLPRMIAAGPPSPPPRPAATGHVTILTSGTTGTPKGASRTAAPLTLDPAAALLERIPLRAGDRARIAAPLFHAWGLAGLMLGMALGMSFVLRRRFDPEQALADIDAHGCQVLVAVPVMLGRILALPPEVLSRHRTGSLRAVCSSGSALPGDLATAWMDAFGENLYNMYGSTEVSAVTLATPADMRAAPGTAGRPVRGSTVRLLDDEGHPVPNGETGRIYVANAMLFEGYTGGGDKDRRDGLMSTGDVGRFDAAGRLFVQGRDDEMIVSGGENVFPKEVEDALARHPAVVEAAAVGVPDPEFGQRLRAFVVLRAPAGEDELKAHIRASLARYKVPREIVVLDELPHNPTGKLLKRELENRKPD